MKPNIPKSDEVFSYYQPHSGLSSYIAYYSMTKPHTALSSISPVFIPDLGGSIIVSRYENHLGLIVWGPFNKLTKIENNQLEPLEQYFIEFQPGGLSRLVFPNSNELLNQKTPLAEIDFEINNAIKLIFDRNNYVPSELVSFLDRFFLGLLANKRDILENGRHVLSVLQDLGQNRVMNDLSKETHYSKRHINRYLNALTGVSGKNYAQVKRFNNATRILKESSVSIEQAALLLDYYDTSHFIHDFTVFAGMSPTDYRKNMSCFYSDSTKRL